MNLGPNLGQVLVGSGSNHGSKPNVTTPNRIYSMESSIEDASTSMRGCRSGVVCALEQVSGGLIVQVDNGLP